MITARLTIPLPANQKKKLRAMWALARGQAVRYVDSDGIVRRVCPQGWHSWHGEVDLEITQGVSK